MSNPNTEPGLGGPGPAGPPSSDTVRDALEPTPTPPPAASFDDAMRDAELRVAEAHNREIVEREAERRRVHLETTARLREVEKGSDAHFELLSLRQRWTLPLDDDDYVLWMQHHLLEQHGKAMADEASQKRRERAKQMARGPAIGIAIVLGLATVAGIGWFLRGSAEKNRSTATSAPAATTEPAAPAPSAPAAPAATTEPVVAPAASTPAASASPPPGEGTATPASAAPISGSPAPGGTPKAAPPKPRAAKKDPWEPEF